MELDYYIKKLKQMRTYKTIKWILKDHIKKNVKSLWTYEDDNFTCIYEYYPSDVRIYTSQQMLEHIEVLLKEQKDGI
jgi:hypothetical protein